MKHITLHSIMFLLTITTLPASTFPSGSPPLLPNETALSWHASTDDTTTSAAAHQCPLNSLTHETSTTKLVSILNAGRLQPLSIHKQGATTDTVGTAADDVIYTQLVPSWIIHPESSSCGFGEVVLELPMTQLTSRTDWHISSGWQYYGNYVPGKSARKDEEIRAVQLIEEISDNYNTAILYFLGVYGCELDAFASKKSQRYSYDALRSRFENELLFKDDIDLTNLKFRIYFLSEEKQELFIKENTEIFRRLDILDSGENMSGAHYITVEYH